MRRITGLCAAKGVRDTVIPQHSALRKHDIGRDGKLIQDIARSQPDEAACIRRRQRELRNDVFVALPFRNALPLRPVFCRKEIQQTRIRVRKKGRTAPARRLKRRFFDAFRMVGNRLNGVRRVRFTAVCIHCADDVLHRAAVIVAVAVEPDSRPRGDIQQRNGVSLVVNRAEHARICVVQVLARRLSFIIGSQREAVDGAAAARLQVVHGAYARIVENVCAVFPNVHSLSGAQRLVKSHVQLAVPAIQIPVRRAAARHCGQRRSPSNPFRGVPDRRLCDSLREGAVRSQVRAPAQLCKCARLFARHPLGRGNPGFRSALRRPAPGRRKNRQQNLRRSTAAPCQRMRANAVDQETELPHEIPGRAGRFDRQEDDPVQRPVRAKDGLQFGFSAGPGASIPCFAQDLKFLAQLRPQPREPRIHPIHIAGPPRRIRLPGHPDEQNSARAAQGHFSLHDHPSLPSNRRHPAAARACCTM